MPTVNGKKFSYDKQGRKDAREYARKRDKNLKNKGRK